MWSVDEAVAVGGVGSAIVNLFQLLWRPFRGEVVPPGILEHFPRVLAGNGCVAKTG